MTDNLLIYISDNIEFLTTQVISINDKFLILYNALYLLGALLAGIFILWFLFKIINVFH